MAIDGRRASHQRCIWDSRVLSWSEQVASAPFALVRDAVCEIAGPRPTDQCVDLGAGTGFITLPIASVAASMLAVDVAPLMLATLARQAKQAGLDNVHTVVFDIAELTLPPGSVDLIVSSYALHSLPHRRKRRLLAKAHSWLRPGGRLVIADMMLGRGLSARDRSILSDKSRRLLKQGPGGAWRLVRNAAELGLGLGENRPATPAWWTRALTGAGFEQVRYRGVVAEAGVVAGVKRSA